MIIAEFFRKNGDFTGFKINGHAGYDDYGKDIVCASVSSAIQLIANMVTDVFGFEAELNAENNTVVLKTSISCDKTLQNLYNGLVMHLNLLSQEFKGTIKIKFTEV